MPKDFVLASSQGTITVCMRAVPTGIPCALKATSETEYAKLLDQTY